VTYSQAYLEQGRYAEAIASTGAETELVDPRTPDVGFTDATSVFLPVAQGRQTEDTGGAMTLADLGRDGHLDLIDGGGPSLRLLRHDGSRFVDATLSWFGITGVAPAFGAIAGDYDNDGRVDLLVLRRDGITLYRESAPGRFEDVTQAAGLGALRSVPPGRAAAWVDADHDGDLDLVVTIAGSATGAGPEGPSHVRLLRNNGDGTFTDITAQAGVSVPHALTAIVPTDFDNRRDLDLLMAGPGGPPVLFRPRRDGTFKDVAASAGLSVAGDVSAIAAGDVNKDGYPDFFFGRADGPGTLALSDGRAGFKTAPLPAAAGARAAQIL